MAEFTIHEHNRGQWEVCDPQGHFIISEWVTKKEAQSICRRENKKLEIKGRMFGIDLQLLVANLMPLDRLSVESVNNTINELFDYNDTENFILFEKDREFLKECIIAIIYQ